MKKLGNHENKSHAVARSLGDSRATLCSSFFSSSAAVLFSLFLANSSRYSLSQFALTARLSRSSFRSFSQRPSLIDLSTTNSRTLLLYFTDSGSHADAHSLGDFCTTGPFFFPSALSLWSLRPTEGSCPLVFLSVSPSHRLSLEVTLVRWKLVFFFRLLLRAGSPLRSQLARWNLVFF